MTKYKTSSLLLFVTLLLSAAPALASSDSEGAVDKAIIEAVTETSFLTLPMNVELENGFDEEAVKLKASEDITSASVTQKIQSDLTDEFKANLGIIRTDPMVQRIETRPASLPRGREFMPLDSKLGAGISSKFNMSAPR